MFVAAYGTPFTCQGLRVVTGLALPPPNTGMLGGVIVEILLVSFVLITRKARGAVLPFRPVLLWSRLAPSYPNVVLTESGSLIAVSVESACTVRVVPRPKGSVMRSEERRVG